MDINGIQKLNQVDTNSLKNKTNVENQKEGKPNSVFGSGFSGKAEGEISYTGKTNDEIGYTGTVAYSNDVEYSGEMQDNVGRLDYRTEYKTVSNIAKTAAEAATAGAAAGIAEGATKIDKTEVNKLDDNPPDKGEITKEGKDINKMPDNDTTGKVNNKNDFLEYKADYMTDYKY